jgi:hypothetical protein
MHAAWRASSASHTQGSHRVFKRKGEPVILNFQNRKGLIPAYQARQLVAMMLKYESET